MSVTSISNIEQAVQSANHWLKEIASDSQVEDAGHAYSVLRAVLHTLRDRLSVDEAADFAAQLPVFWRGVFFEGWQPSHVPAPKNCSGGFLRDLERGLRKGTCLSPQRAAQLVFELLSRRLTEGQMRHLRQALPADLLQQWTPSRAW